MAIDILRHLSPSLAAERFSDEWPFVEAPLVASVRGMGRDFGARHVLSDVNIDVRAGEFVALLGASGSGKTTILRAIAELDTEATGEFLLPENRAVVFQEHRLLPWVSVWRNVAIGLPRREAKQRALDALTEVDLVDRADAWPGTLSGGEAQRVALARALVRQPDILLLDEPFASLDALTRLRMQQFVARLCLQHGFAVLLVTHDVDEAVMLADRALVLERGRIAWEVAIDHPRPRNPEFPGRTELRNLLLSRLGIDPMPSAGPSDPPPQSNHS
jgi:sulfonate transport system ATP-binding protein